MQQTNVVKINLDVDRLPKLKTELAAIEFWDNDYYRATLHTKIDNDALRSRQKRREEILDEITRLQLTGIQLEALGLKGLPRANLSGFLARTTGRGVRRN